MKNIINQINSLLILPSVIIAAIICAGNSNPVSAANGDNLSGSIQTSDASGASVNQNIYDHKSDVYLNGGPQNANGNGLPVGTYYFQVTTPSGALLSTDPAVCRQLVVALNSSGKGVVSGMANFGNGANERPLTCAATDHLNGAFNPANGTTPVQLMPFADTTNNGGEYKVWLIRKTSNTIVAAGGIVINFDNSDSKTDNFKVKPSNPPPPVEPTVTYTLRGCKFYDRNADGVRNGGEAGVQGVRIVVAVNGVKDAAPIETGADGCWERAGVSANAEYFVEEITPLTGMEPVVYWVQTAPSRISIPDPNGMPGDVLVVRAYRGTATGGTPIDDVVVIGNLDFGNVCFGPAAGGKTKGWWTNKNGEDEMKAGALGSTVDAGVYPAAVSPADSSGMSGDLYFLRRLNLFGEALVRKQTITTEFNPALYSEFKSWLTNANAYNMSYMLSAQLAAASLNVRHKHFPNGDNQIVDAGNVCDAGGYCLGITNIGNVRLLANESLGGAGGNITISGGSHRESQELMKNFLDGINNNWLPFAQESACPVVYAPDEPLL